MERVSVEDADADEPDPGVERRRLSAPLDAAGVAINRYRIGPGEGFPGGLHAHADQEEVFVVLAGRAVFETMAGEVAVAEGEAIRFAPGEFQSGRNASDGDLVALALGAPRESEDVRIPVPCPDCGRSEVRIETGGSEPRFVCPDCTADCVPAPCPTCGDDDLRVTLGEGGEPTVVCRGCAAAFERPPLRE